jgi:hypothetical protein
MDNRRKVYIIDGIENNTYVRKGVYSSYFKASSALQKLLEDARKNGEHFTKTFSASDRKSHLLIYDKSNIVLKKDYYISVERVF